MWHGAATEVIKSPIADVQSATAGGITAIEKISQARALAELVKKMPKLDWRQRESVRADLRRKVCRLLAMYGYPPDLSEDGYPAPQPF